VQLAKHNSGHVISVPGNEVIVGNETADQLAKLGSECPHQLAAPQQELPGKLSGTG
jgi:hypothetical protein